ncbi:MAG: DUF3341 domain-containing protein [Nitrospirae bacterium]|nr:DUF3341 domain-containing protein [Nitrospirota bacterium]
MVNACGIFPDPETALHAIRELKKAGYREMLCQSPIPYEDIQMELKPKSARVWFFSGLGAAFGILFGLTLVLGTFFLANIMTGGKPIMSIPPALVIAYECANLFGFIGTFTGLVLLTRRWRRKVSFYEERASEDKLVLFVECPDGHLTQVQNHLKKAGGDIRMLEAGGV